MTATMTRKPTVRARNTEPAVASGTCRWISRWDGNWGTLRISVETKAGTVTSDYDLIDVQDVPWRKAAGQRGYLLCKLGGADTDRYVVDPDCGSCTCPDATIRGKGLPWRCKHSRSLRSLLARLFQPTTLATVSVPTCKAV